jgi:hypothetical protein
MKINRAALAALCLLATPACADPISGYVKANGTVSVPSSLYSVTHKKPGHYLITFTTPITPKASCLATAFRGQFVKKIVETDTTCLVVINGYAEQHGEDGAFSFIAVPMSN